MIRTLLKLLSRYRTTVLYGIIGVSAVVVDMSVFYALYNFFGVFPVVATVLSVATATVFSFYTNAYLNFRTKDLIKSRVTSFIIVSALGMGLSAWAIHFFSSEAVSANLVKALSLPPIAALQYLLNANITFRKKIEEVDPEERKGEEFSEFADRKWRKRKHVAVIGGGFTGLTAAYELSKVGYNVTLFEAGDTLGGLVAGFSLDGVPLERAYHFLYKTDDDIIGLAHEVGVGDKLHFHQSSLSLYYDGELYPFMTPGDLLRFTPLTLFQRVRAGVVALYLSWETRWHSFARVTAMKWLTRWCGKRVTEVIWEPILRGKFFDHYDSIAMSYVWSRVYVRANSKDPGDVTEKLGYFDGGFQTFSNALAQKAQKCGVKVVYNASIESIRHKDGEVHIQSSKGKEVFDAALSTTPNHVFSKLVKDDPRITPEYVEHLNATDYLGAVLMVFSADRKFTDYFWHNINDTKHPFLVLLSLSALVGPENVGGKHIYYIGAYVPHDHHYFTASDEEIQKEWIQGTKEMFPEFDESSITDCRIFRFKNAQHIVDVNYERKIVPYKTPVPGVFLSNFSQIFPDDRGTNYAVREGRKVARLLDNDLVERTYKDHHPDTNGDKRHKEPDLSIILPTFNESGNVGPLLKRLFRVMRATDLTFECIFVDDSTDSTPYNIAAEAKRRSQIYLVKREGEEARSGLTKAFFRGFRSARGKTIVCMDTDLQHPPETIPELIYALDERAADVAIASRYAGDGSSGGLAGSYRHFVSHATTYLTWLLLPVTRATSDPMTGFFAFRRELLKDTSFSSFGFKILVELLATGQNLKVVEVPFTFAKRVHNDSKASLVQGLRFFKDTGRLFMNDGAGSVATKYLLTAGSFTLVYIGAVATGLVTFLLSFFNVGGVIAHIAGLVFISMLVTPMVFTLIFPRLRSSVSLSAIGLIMLWVFLNSWVFFVIGGMNIHGDLAETVVEGLLFSLTSLGLLILLRPIWTGDRKALLSSERWVITGAGVASFLIILNFLSFDNIGEVLLLAGYCLVVIQGLFALYLMIYIWDRGDDAGSNGFPAEFLPPRYSFTAIIPCKHETSVIADTIKAVGNMEYPDELTQVIVVVHKESDDGTIEIAQEAIEEVGKDNIQVVTYSAEPVNKPHGLNQGLKHATSDYVVIFDAEDEPHPGLYKAINTVLVQDGYDVLQSGVQLMNYESSWYSLFNVLEYYFWFKSALHFFVKHGVVPLGGVTVFFSREWLERVGGWDNTCLTEDAEVGFRLSQAGANIGIVYDAVYVTREQTPHTLWGFIKQRTRWAQGFLQILFRGEWRKLPTTSSKMLALYALAWPLLLPPLVFLFLFGVIVAFVANLPPMLALIANIPLLVFLMFIAVQILGLYEFCKDHGRPFPWSRLPLAVVMFYPFTVILAFSGFRALYRNVFQITTWEKTDHLNAYRVAASESDVASKVATSNR